jgi:hypothetical protein
MKGNNRKKKVLRRRHKSIRDHKLPRRGVRVGRRSAADYIGVSPNTLAKWASVGRPYIPYFLVGGKAVYDTVDLDQFLEGCRANEVAGETL